MRMLISSRNVPGVSIAVVDGDNIWAEVSHCFIDIFMLKPLITKGEMLS
jgi:hypothetical protein